MVGKHVSRVSRSARVTNVLIHSILVVVALIAVARVQGLAGAHKHPAAGHGEGLGFQASVAAGVVYVVAAGNHSKDASNVTPAKVEGAITVGSYAFDGSFSSFSNWGPKVDLLAPGEGMWYNMGRKIDKHTPEMLSAVLAAHLNSWKCTTSAMRMPQLHLL